MVCILLYSRQQSCFSLLCPVTPTLHQNESGSPLGGIKNNFSSDAATTTPPPAASQFIYRGNKNPKRTRCRQLHTLTGRKDNMSNMQNGGKLICDFTIRSDTRVLLSQHLSFFCCSFYRFKSFMF